MIELREALDEAVFKEVSEDGIVEIGLYGDGRPESIELHLEGPWTRKSNGGAVRNPHSVHWNNVFFRAIEDGTW